MIELERLDLFLQSSGDGPCLDTKAPSQEAGKARGNGKNLDLPWQWRSSRSTFRVCLFESLQCTLGGGDFHACLLLTLKWLG